VIVRKWEALATADGADKYQEHFATVVVDKLKTLDGFLGAQVLRAVDADADDDNVKLMDLTYWDSFDSITAFAGVDVRTAIVDEIARQYLVSFDDTVSHYRLAVDTISAPA
jgi:heme-degrading monooxygenase HmoA